uniref:Cytochrome b5 heme-binding domain-containing protein n=1 Tax=Heterorhabditis bacteriophora TaxID=37862 RepID=A0A1I7WP51_HETBA
MGAEDSFNHSGVEKPLLLGVNGRLYDVAQFAKKHPGGEKGDPILDSKRGVLSRVGGLGADYWMWIHQPYEGTLRSVLWCSRMGCFFCDWSFGLDSCRIFAASLGFPLEARSKFKDSDCTTFSTSWFVTKHIFCAFGSGKLFGYISYDMMHYYLHHGRPRPLTNMHYRKVYHHNHHFKDFDAGFGISTSLWDYIFDTVGLGPL